jgi:hypothetical protein
MMPNAGAHLLPEAEATQERRLEAVSCKALIMIEASPPAYRSGMLAVGHNVTKEGRDRMRLYNPQHPFYCGSAFHARSLSGCIMRHDGELRVHRTMQAAPDPFRTAMAPYRAGLVGAVAGLGTWYGRADLCTPEPRPFGLGHTLSRTAMPGGTANHDQSAAPKMAPFRRGGLGPKA